MCARNWTFQQCVPQIPTPQVILIDVAVDFFSHLDEIEKKKIVSFVEEEQRELVAIRAQPTHRREEEEAVAGSFVACLQ